MKHYLFIIRRSPYQSAQAGEKLDQILTAAAFDQSVSLLFIDDGVWQLKAQRSAQVTDVKALDAMLKALPLYGVDQLYVETESMQQRGLDAEQLFLPATLIPRSELSALLAEHEIIVADS